MDEQGLTRAELVAKLQSMDGLLLSDTQWIRDGSYPDGIDYGQPESMGSRRWSIQGAAWFVVKQPFHYRQICMALLAAMNRPMTLIQEYEAGLTFAQMKEWLANAIDHAKNNDPWTPYLV